MVTDNFTRYAETAPLTDKSAASVAWFIFSKVVCRYGSLCILLSDNGSEFSNSILNQLTEFHKISRRHSSPYYPQGNGLTEQTNQTLVRKLSKLHDDSLLNWDNLLMVATFSYNVSFNSSIQMSPFKALFGFEPRLSAEACITTYGTSIQDHGNL